MFFLEKWRTCRLRRSLLLQLYEETADNMERFYVMFQLGRLRFFSLTMWEKAAVLPAEWGADFRAYIAAVSAYHDSLRRFQEFEQWYSGQTAHKTRENAMELHQRKQTAQQQFDPLQETIRRGLADLENQLLARGWLKTRCRYTQETTVEKG